jgi:hypothetical protein
LVLHLEEGYFDTPLDWIKVFVQQQTFELFVDRLQMLTENLLENTTLVVSGEVGPVMDYELMGDEFHREVEEGDLVA